LSIVDVGEIVDMDFFIVRRESKKVLTTVMRAFKSRGFLHLMFEERFAFPACCDEVGSHTHHKRNVRVERIGALASDTVTRKTDVTFRPAKNIF
jgi:hypothetical protein